MGERTWHLGSLSWRVFACEGGWYWELCRNGVKLNGGIAEREGYAYHLAYAAACWERSKASRARR